MLYRYVWVLLFLVYRGLFKRAFYHNTKVVKFRRPYILASNHCNAFLDPIVVAAQLKREVNFLVRGDIFNSPIKRYFLNALHQIPIYRGRDGLGNLKENNEQTFRKVYEILEENKITMIFPEGDCVPEKRLRPLKKGAARMAFGVMTKNNWEIDPYILPVAVNYAYHTQFRTEFMVGFDNSIRIMDYKELYLENEAKAINKLTQDIAAGIKNQLIEIPKHLEKETEILFQIYRSGLNYSSILWRRNENTRLKAEQGLAKSFAELETENPNEFESIKAKINQYEELLNQSNLTDNGIYSVLKHRSINFLSYLAFPIFMLGYIINKPIKNFIEKSVQKKIKKDEFKLSIKMGFLLAIYHILALVVFSITWIFFGIAWAFGSLVLLYISSWWSTLLKERYQLNKEILNAKNFKSKNIEKFNTLAELRKNINQKLNITS